VSLGGAPGRPDPQRGWHPRPAGREHYRSRWGKHAPGCRARWSVHRDL